jgi:protein O-GlcNAc transferase
MDTALLQYLNELRASGRFKELRVAADWGKVQPSEKLVTARLFVHACRHLSDGAAANAALCAVAVDSFSASAEEVAQLAEELLQCCAFREAAVLIGKLRHSGAPHGLYLTAVVQRIRGDWVGLLETTQHMHSLGGSWSVLATIQNAWALIDQGLTAQAAPLLDAFQAPQHAGLIKLRCRLLLAQAKPTEAIRLLGEIQELQPDDWEWPALMAQALAHDALYVQEGPKFDEVRRLFETALARQPAQPEALHHRAKWWIMCGKPENALEDINRALALMPWFEAPLLLWLNHLSSSREFHAALTWLDAQRRQSDSAIRAGAALDLLRRSAATRDEVFSAYRSLDRQHGRSPDFLRAAGAALQAVGLLDQASACYTRALALSPHDFGVLNNLAVLERDRGDGEAAVARWRQLLESGAFNDTVLLNLGHVLRERGDHGDAQRCFDSVLSRQPRNASALRGRAENAFAAGDSETAWAYAVQSLESDRANPLAWKTAAGVAGRREGPKAAQRLLEQGLTVAQPPLELHRAVLGHLLASRPAAQAVQAARNWLLNAPHRLRIEYLMMVADAELEAGHFDACERTLREAVCADISKGNQALIRFYESRTREGAARRVAEQLVAALPQEQRHWGLLAEVLYRQKRYDQALDALKKGLEIDPDRLSMRRQQVAMLLERERHTEAVAVAMDFADRLQLPPAFALAVEALHRANRPHDAVAIVRQRLQARPKDRALQLMLVNCLRRVGGWQESLTVLAALYAQEPGNFQVARQYATELVEHGQPQEAFALVQQLLHHHRERPDLQEAAIGLLLEQGNVEAAREEVKRSLQRFDSNIELWRLAMQVEKRGQAPAAEAGYLREVMKRFPPVQWIGGSMSACIRLGLVDELQQGLNAWRTQEPDSTAPWWAAYLAAKELKRFEHAHASLEKIEQLRGPRAEVHAARAALFNEASLSDRTIAEQRKAIELKPDFSPYYEALLNYLVKAGEFDEFDALMNRIEHMLGDRRYASYSSYFFNINCHPSWTSQQIWRFYHQWYDRAVKPGLPLQKPWSVSIDPRRRLRIGYVSPDFRRHAVAYFSEPLLCRHDREQFEIFAYAHLENDIHDNYTARFKSYVDHWVPIQHLSDVELERRIRDDHIDILVDLAGHTTNNRLGVMLRKPAPVQVSWVLGAGQTTGLPQVDYLAADAVTLPPSFESCVAERIVRLPTPGMPYRPADDHLPTSPLPTLDTGRVVLGVLARPLRINRNCLSTWAQILLQCPAAVIQFDHAPYTQQAIQQRIVAQFAEHGVDAERVLFAHTHPYWQALSNIDLQLDPFPAGSGTVVSDGLWMERLAVTLRSRPAMGLAATAQLTALGLDEWCVGESVAEYIDKAVALVKQPGQLADLSKGLRQRMSASSLMDYERYGREAAAMYRQMWVDWCAMQSSTRAVAAVAPATST